MPSIIEYAELGEFIDAPLKTYSSGMRARLGFAIATSIDPDILLLDEVLATGDAAFRAKSKARVIEIVKAAKAVVLVTHDMDWVTEYCNRALLIERGPRGHGGRAGRGRGRPPGAHGGGPRPAPGRRRGGRRRPAHRARPVTERLLAAGAARVAVRRPGLAVVLAGCAEPGAVDQSAARSWSRRRVAPSPAQPDGHARADAEPRADARSRRRRRARPRSASRPR